MSDNSEKTPFLQRFRVPALVGMAVVCSVTGYLLSSQFLATDSRDRESFTATGPESTPGNLTQPPATPGEFSTPASNLPETGMGISPKASDVETSSVTENSENSNNRHSVPEQIAAHMTVADGHLRSGNTVAAHRLYAMLRDESQGPVPPAIQFRLGLAAEAFGDFSTALSSYEALLIIRGENPWHGVALSGRARCLQALGRTDLLTRDFLPLVAVDDSVILAEQQRELMHLLGRAMIPAARPSAPSDLLHDDIIAIPEYHIDVGRILEGLPTSVVAVTPPTVPPKFSIIQALSAQADMIFLQAHIPDSPVSEVISEIGRQCGLRIEFAGGSRVIAADRTAAIHTDDKSFALILDGLTIPNGLLWVQSDSTIRIASRAEVSSEQAEPVLNAAAERLLRLALLESPDSAQSSFTRIALGGLLFRQQRYADAAHLFSMTLDSKYKIGLRSETAFNLGKSQMKLLQPQKALANFLLGVDTTSGAPDVRLACHLYAARIQIQMAERKKAVVLLRRALSLSEDRDMEPVVALMLSSGYHLAASTHGANDILMKRRELFGKKSDRAAAAFLSALARFRAAVLDDRLKREARDVVASLAEFDASEQFGEHWHILAAEACDEIGLVEPARRHWQAAFELLPDVPLKGYVISQLAEGYRTDHQYENAEDLLRLAPLESSELIAHTLQLQSAHVALQRGDPEFAKEKCIAVLRESEDPQTQIRGMKLLGFAYEQLGDHRAAVYCFAGMLKEAVANESGGGLPVVPEIRK